MSFLKQLSNFDPLQSFPLAQLGAVEVSDLAFVLSLLIFIIISFIAFAMIQSRDKCQVELEQKNKEIKKLKESMMLKNRRNHALQSQVSRTSEQLTSHDEFKAAINHLVGHDLKNAINAIMGLSKKEDDKRMATVKTCGDLALSMICNMLDVQRFEEQKISLQLRQHCLRETLEEAKAQVYFLFAMKNLELKIDIPDGMVVLIDKDTMRRTFVNLLVNAVKYSKVGSAVWVRVNNIVDELGETCTQITVQDQGEGIAASRLPFIFDKHWKRDTKDIGKVASAGLGLVYCRYVLEAHDGKISVTSERGVGTRFDLHLPYLETIASSCDPQNDSLSIEREAVTINDDHLGLIREYGRRLYGLTVYEITKIREVINELGEMDIKTTWTGELQLAVYQGDQQKYDQLVDMIH